VSHSRLTSPLGASATGASTSIRPALLGKGFRPFFLLAALYAAGVVPIWLLMFGGQLDAAPHLGAMYWHAHEMVFGFAAAVIAGFLLTAVGNWTGRETAVGIPLALLAVLWMLGRVAILLGDVLPGALSAAVDLAFLPALALVCTRPLLAAKSWRNYPLIAILGGLTLANLGVHLGAHGIYPHWLRLGNIVAVDIVVLVVVVISGRVIPMFTRNTTGVATARTLPWLDRLAALAVALVALADAAGLDLRVAAAASGIGAAALFVRGFLFGARQIWRHPLLWVLHAAHAFIAVGLLLRAGASLTPELPWSSALHALTAGGIGMATLGMMARVGLGHTGRMLVVPRSIAIAFGLVAAGAALRVLAGWLPPGAYLPSLSFAGLLWAAGFGIYAVVHGPILLSPRVDGRPG